MPLCGPGEARVGGVGDLEDEGGLVGGRQGGDAGVLQELSVVEVVGRLRGGGRVEQRDAGAEEEVVQEDAALFVGVCV